MTSLNGKKIAFVATNGFEDSELTSPWQAVTDAGGTAVMIAPESGSIEGKNGHSQPVEKTSGEADASEFDGLVIPGGVVNADHLRMDAASVALVKDFFSQHKPVGVICHGAWILTEADLVRGRTITSYPSLKTDLRNAGAEWVDQEVVVDAGLVSSRNPDDLPAFNKKIVEEFAEGKHEDQTA
jgi:protease I